MGAASVVDGEKHGDRLQAHRSKLVRAHVEAQRGQIMIDYLPAYAPDMNPVECIWGYLKHHAMPNYSARDLGDVASRARTNLRSMQRRTTATRRRSDQHCCS